MNKQHIKMTTVSQSYSTVCFTLSPEGWPVTPPSTGEGGERVTPGTGLPKGGQLV